MKFFVVAACVLAVAIASPASLREGGITAQRELPALSHEEIHDKFGQYALRYVTAEGTIVSERGRLVPNHDGDGYVLVYEGETTQVDSDGKTHTTKYTAGFDGFNVESDNLSEAPKVSVVPVEVPAAVV